MWRMIRRRIGPVTLLSILLGVLGTVLAFEYSETGPIAAILSSYLSVIVGIFEHISRRLSQAKPPTGMALASRISKPYMQTMAQALLSMELSALEQMLKPKQEFSNEAEFFRF